MRSQLLCKHILTLGVLITVLANAAAGRVIINGTNQEGQKHGAGNHLRVDKILRGIPSRWHPRSASLPLSRIAKSMAFVKWTTNDGRENGCGGTLIHKQWVLTAAHCVYDPPHIPARRFSVMLGNLNIRQGKYYEVDRVIIHDRYKREVVIPPRQIDLGVDNNVLHWFEGNDLALLKLREEVDTSKGNVKVAARLAEGRESFDNKECVAAGWGLTELKVFPDHLVEWTIPKMISQSKCENYGHEIKFSNYWRERHICVFDVKDSRKGICPGDSGGPLMCGPGHDTLVAVAKSSNGDCSDGKKKNLYPDVYTRVAPHLTWIYSIVPRGTKRPHNVV